jgi:hypothetical protein
MLKNSFSKSLVLVISLGQFSKKANLKQHYFKIHVTVKKKKDHHPNI